MFNFPSRTYTHWSTPRVQFSIDSLHTLNNSPSRQFHLGPTHTQKLPLVQFSIEVLYTHWSTPRVQFSIEDLQTLVNSPCKIFHRGPTHTGQLPVFNFPSRTWSTPRVQFSIDSLHALNNSPSELRHYLRDYMQAEYQARKGLEQKQLSPSPLSCLRNI